MTDRIEQARDVLGMIREDCAKDAAQVDRTPFTPRGVGEQFGTTLALIAGLAKVVEVLMAELDATNRVLDSRTEHLA